MAESYRVAVLGPVPRDHITTHEGAVVDKYGCGLNSVAALSSLMGGQGEITLVTHVRQVDYGSGRPKDRHSVSAARSRPSAVG
jgi:hypothetical protein